MSYTGRFEQKLMFKQERWNLSELATSHKNPQFAKQITNLENEVKKFEKLKAGLKPSIPPEDFFK